jgi:hypothetical protein
MARSELDQARIAVSDALKKITESPDFQPKSNATYDNLSIVPPHELNALSMGSGVTGRSLEKLREDLPSGVMEIIINNEGKTIFLGNGSSNAPLEISNEQRSAHRQPNHKVIIDQVDLFLLLEDLDTLEALLNKKGFSETFDIGAQRKRVQALVDASQNPQENIEVRTGLIGVDQFKDLEETGDIVFNAWGPSGLTIGAQMKFVKPGGALIMPGRLMNFNRMEPELRASGALDSVERIEEMGGGPPDWDYALKFIKKQSTPS